ncbi:MAG: 30S ribosomal protein S8 [Deltaproteobacteria bacterium]|nr:30S ribosomal protein S8 [Deltaproteobacteria bacterium]
MNSDPLSDCFTRLRNAAKARQDSVSIPYSKLKEQVLNLLRDEGFLTEISVSETAKHQKALVAQLKYDRTGSPALEHIRRISKPGHRIYGRAPTTSNVRSGLGFQIFTTSKGVMTSRQAIAQKAGGEILAEVW